MATLPVQSAIPSGSPTFLPNSLPSSFPTFLPTSLTICFPTSFSRGHLRQHPQLRLACSPSSPPLPIRAISILTSFPNPFDTFILIPFHIFVPAPSPFPLLSCVTTPLISFLPLSRSSSIPLSCRLTSNFKLYKPGHTCHLFNVIHILTALATVHELAQSQMTC